jgi:putative lipoprotein
LIARLAAAAQVLALATAATGWPSAGHAQATARPPAFASTMRCGEHEAVVGVDGDTVQLQVAGERFTLRAVRTASGAKYEAPDDPGTSFWSHGRDAQVSVRGQAWPACRLTTPDDRAALLQGVEWVVEYIDRGGIIDRSRVTLNFAPDGDLGGQTGGQTGGQNTGPADARGDGPRSGQLSGRAGCNRYIATWRLADEALRIGPPAGTRMACSEALNAQEARFLALLAAVRRHEVGADGALRLLGDDGRRLLLARRA